MVILLSVDLETVVQLEVFVSRAVPRRGVTNRFVDRSACLALLPSAELLWAEQEIKSR